MKTTPILRALARFQSRLSRFAACLSALMLAVILSGLAGQASAAGARISGSLANFDVRYPASLPNDFDILLYGAGLTVADVLSTFPNPQWGPANSITASVNNDPTSPAFGLDCIKVRYVGPPLPALVGQMRHFGLRLKPGTAVAHHPRYPPPIASGPGLPKSRRYRRDGRAWHDGHPDHPADGRVYGGYRRQWCATAVPDFNPLRSRFGLVSPDISGN